MHNFMTCCRTVCDRFALIRIWNDPCSSTGYRDYCNVCAGLILEFNQKMIKNGEIELKWEKIQYKITDFFPGKFETPQLFASKGDREYWTQKCLLEGDWSEEQFYEEFGWAEYYGPAGCSFAQRPIREYNGHSTLFTQSGGLDI